MERAGLPRVEGYDDLVEIGHGGFSVVYRARQRRFDREVAVKLIDRRAFAGSSIDRFDRECRAMGALSWHPNVVAVYDSGVADDGRPYLSMEYLPDGSWADHLADAGPATWQEALEVGVEVAGALEAAHRIGILHRDLKPGNLLVGPAGTKLADFGIAGLASGRQTTATGNHALTIAYSAPEVLEGRRADARSDVYSLGATLHALVSGRSPFSRPEDDSDAAIVLRAARGDVAELDPSLPDAVVEVIRLAMHHDPTQRPAGAEQLGELLRDAQRSCGLDPTPLRITRSRVRQSPEGRRPAAGPQNAPGPPGRDATPPPGDAPPRPYDERRASAGAETPGRGDPGETRVVDRRQPSAGDSDDTVIIGSSAPLHDPGRGDPRPTRQIEPGLPVAGDHPVPPDPGSDGPMPRHDAPDDRDHNAEGPAVIHNDGGDEFDTSGRSGPRRRTLRVLAAVFALALLVPIAALWSASSDDDDPAEGASATVAVCAGATTTSTTSGATEPDAPASTTAVPASTTAVPASTVSTGNSGGLSDAIRAAVRDVQEARAELEVAVYDFSGRPGLGVDVTEGLVERGYDNASFEGEVDTALSGTIVYHAPGCTQEAQDLAGSLGLQDPDLREMESAEYGDRPGRTDLVLYVGPDREDWPPS